MVETTRQFSVLSASVIVRENATDLVEVCLGYYDLGRWNNLTNPCPWYSHVKPVLRIEAEHDKGAEWVRNEFRIEPKVTYA